jgi:hypothetical protein
VTCPANFSRLRDDRSGPRAWIGCCRGEGGLLAPVADRNNAAPSLYESYMSGRNTSQITSGRGDFGGSEKYR